MMGTNVGALSVSLGLDAAQYTEGLTKADTQAQQFAQQQIRTQASIDRTVKSLEKQAAQVGLTTNQIKLQALAAKGASDAQLAAAQAALDKQEQATKALKDSAGSNAINEVIDALKREAAQAGLTRREIELQALSARGANAEQIAAATAALAASEAAANAVKKQLATQSIDAVIDAMKREAAQAGLTKREIELQGLAAKGASAEQLAAAEQILTAREAASASAKKDDATAAIDATVTALQREAVQAKLTRTEIELQNLEAKGASEAQLASAAISLKAVEDAAVARKKFAKDAAEAAAAEEGFSLASAGARRELLVLGHELSQGNFKKAAGSFQVLAEHSNATSLIFNTTTLAVAGAVAVLGSFAIAAIKGAEESHALARAIDETGNVAGLTEGKFNDLAAAQAKQTNSTIGASRDLLQSLAASGRFSGEALTSAGTAASYFAKATGASTEEVGKEFVGLADDVVGGADRMNRQYHFLDATQLQYIRTLHEQGDEQKAFIVAADALSERLKGTSTNLGTLESAWQKIKNAASGAWDSMLNVGRTETVEEKLATVEKQIEQARSSSFYQTPTATALPASIYTQPAASVPASIYSTAAPSLAQTQSIYGSQNEADLRMRQASLQDELKLTNRIAETQAAKVRQDEAEIAVMHLKESSLTKQEKLTRDLANANAIFDRASAAKDDPARLKVLADIREKAFPANAQKSTLDLDVAKIKAAAQSETEIYTAANQVFAALRAAGLIDDEHYYAEKLFLLQSNSAAEEKALTAEIARRKQQTFVGDGAENKANENAKAITEAEAKLAKVRKDAAAQETVLGVESAAAQRKRAAGYLAEELAAQQSLDATKRAHAEEIALVGVGGEARIQATAHSQITDRYQAEIDRLNADIATKRAAGGGTATKDDEDAYARRLALLQDFQSKSLTEWDAYYAKLKATESDVTLGFQKGLADYETGIGSMSERTAKLTGDTFKSLEDILVSFATTGKLSFKSLENTIIAGIVRISVQEALLKPFAAYLQGSAGGYGATSAASSSGLLGGFLGLFGGGGSSAGASAVDNGSVNLFAGAAPGLASGGRALPGKLYPVTERGPEVLDVNGKQYLMTGAGRANVTPVSSGDGSTTQRPIQIIQHFPPGTTKTTADQAAARAGQAVRKALSRS